MTRFISSQRILILTLLAIAISTSLFAAPVPADQMRTTLRPTTDREILSRFSPESIATFRQQLTSIFQREYDVIAASGQENARLLFAGKMKLVESASDLDMARLMNTGVDLHQLDASVERVHSWVERSRGVSISTIGKHTDSAGFPNAQYSFCGSTRNGSEGMFAAQIVLDVAKGVWSVASRACDEVVVILGEGGNVSLVCIITDAVLAAAEAVFNGFQFCDNDIDSAEIEGSYDRLEHVHGDIATAQSTIVANDNTNTTNIQNNDNANRTQIITNDNTNTTNIQNNDNANRAQIITNDNTNTTNIENNDNANRTQIITNDNANRTLIVNNDNANRDVLIGELRMVSCEIIRLLNTPDGQRASSLPSCSGMPNFPYDWPEKKLSSVPTMPLATSAAMLAPVSALRTADRSEDTVTMETNLLAGKVIASYYLPSSRGGVIERVKELVWNTLHGEEELNIATAQIPAARSEADSADQLLSAGRFVEAYRHYAVAYQKLVPAF